MVRIVRLTLASTATLVAFLGGAAPAEAVAVDCPSQTAAIVSCSNAVAEGGNLVHSEIGITIITLTPTFEVTLPVPGVRERVGAAIRRSRALTGTARRTRR